MKKFICILICLLSTFALFCEKPLLHDIDAVSGKGTGINLSWKLPAEPEKQITEILVYKSILPINNYSELKNLEPIAHLDPEETAFTVYVTDFSDYFFAVISVTDKPYNVVLPSVNATIKGVHINPKIVEDKIEKIEEDKIYAEGTLRETPLPFIDFVETYEDSDSISEDVVINAKRLAKNSNTKSAKLSQYYFEEDLVSPDGGDDFLLFNILKNYFVQRKYKDAILNLERLIGTNITDSVRNRSYFYLGEAYYFSGDYESAVRTFVKIENEYPTLCKKWITSALNLM